MIDNESKGFSPASIPPRRQKESIVPTEPKAGHLARLLQDIVAEQRESGEVRERLAPFLGLTFPITDTALKKAFQEGREITDIYTKGTKFIQTHGRGLSKRWLTRKVFNELAFGFLAKTAQENKDFLLSRSFKYKFLSNVYESDEDDRMRPDGLLINANGEVVGATKYLVNPSDELVQELTAGFQDCMERIRDVVAPRLQFFVAGPMGTDIYVSSSNLDVQIVPLPLSGTSVRALGEEVFNQYRPPSRAPTLRELFEQKRSGNQ